MPRGLGLIVYGTEGIGKTGFSLQFPKPLKCLSIEEAGFVDLNDIDEVPDGCTNINVDSYSQLYKELSHKMEEQTVVIDSALGLQNLITEHSCKEDYNGNWEEFHSYYRGLRVSSPKYASELCQRFENLRNVGKNVILLGHSTTTTFKNPSGPDYDQVEINMDVGVREVFKKWAQCIFYFSLEATILPTKMNKQSGTVLQGKATDSDRMILTSKSPVHSSKNKLRLPEYVSMGSTALEGYTNFVSKLPQNFQEMLNHG